MRLLSWMIVLIFAWSTGYFCNYLALDSDLNWTRAIYYQKLKIAREFRGHGRLLIVGGSGTHYSIDAVQMEQVLGMPVINFGLHGGLGLNTILASVEHEIMSGDVVVLLPEYGILGDDGTGWLSGAFGAAIGKPGIGGVGFKQTVKEMLRGSVVSLPSFGKSMFRLIFGARGRASYTVDDRGDAVYFLEGTATPMVGRYSDVSKQALFRLERFHKHIEEMGARLVFGLPWLLVSNSDKEGTLSYVQKAVKTLSNIAPVLHENDFNIKTDILLFSDSLYHPNKGGRRMRSTDLCLELQDLFTAGEGRYKNKI